MIKRAILEHAQAIKDRATIDFPKTGIVRFEGRNGNGKSIFVEWFKSVISGEITDPVVRKSLITRGFTEGYMQIDTYDNKSLCVFLNIESSRTYIEFKNGDKQTIRRYLSDGKDALFDIVSQLGIQYDPKRGLSLNIFETFGEVLFLTTSPVVNLDFVNLAVSDRYAEKAIENESEFILENMRLKVEREHARDNLKVQLKNIPTYNVEQERQIGIYCSEMANIIRALSVPTLESIPNIPDVSFIDALDSIPTLEVIGMIPDVDFVDALNVDKLVSLSKVRLSSTKGMDELLRLIGILSNVPKVESINVDTGLIRDVLDVIEVTDSIPNIPDISSDIEQLGNLYTALETMTCPLCGSKIYGKEELDG